MFAPFINLRMAGQGGGLSDDARKALLLSLAVFVLGGAGYWGFSAAGFEEFDAGIAASVVLLLVVVGWTATYLTRVSPER